MLLPKGAYNQGMINMAGPTDAVVAIHNAFRHDIELIDAAALDAARGNTGPTTAATIERFRFFNEVLVWHAHGEGWSYSRRSKTSRRQSPRRTRKTTVAWMPHSTH